MPMHDWTRVDAKVFQAFHHHWVSALYDRLNAVLPERLYALPERIASALDCLEHDGQRSDEHRAAGGDSLCTTAVVVRHASRDQLVAAILVVQPGLSDNPRLKAFAGGARELLEHRIHLLVIEPFPSAKHGDVHAAIWQGAQGGDLDLPTDKRLTVVSYECDLEPRAYLESLAVGDALPDMPLFLEPGCYVMVSLEATYQRAYAALPRRCQRVLEGSPK